MSGIENFTRVDVTNEDEVPVQRLAMKEVLVTENFQEMIPELYRTYVPGQRQEHAALFESLCRSIESLTTEVLMHQVNDSLTRLGSSDDHQMGDLRDIKLSLAAAVAVLHERLGKARGE